MSTTETTATPSTGNEQPTLSPAQISAAATNSPATASDAFILGGREFKVLDLGYYQHIDFTAMLQPLFAALAGKAAQKAGLTLPAGITLGPAASELNPSGLLTFAKDKLPEMVAIICNMESVVSKDKTKAVTPEWVVENAKSPIQLAQIVFKQISKNNMIGEFMDFFVQGLPMMMALTR